MSPVSSLPPTALCVAAPPCVALSCVLRFLCCPCSASNAFCLLYVSCMCALRFLACALLPLCCALCRSSSCCLLLYACSANSMRPLLSFALYAYLLSRSSFSACAVVSPCPSASYPLSVCACSLVATLFLSRVYFWCVPSLSVLSWRTPQLLYLCALSVLSLLLTISSLQRLASSIWIVTPHSFVFAFSRRRFRCRQDDLTDIRLNQSDAHRCEQAFTCSSDQVLKCVTETI